MDITKAQFVKGAVEGDPIFLDGTSQIAFIGRSNVGKSSLINKLTNSTIARTSSTPGSTKEINVFNINDSHYFVDLPGHGFAKGSISLRGAIEDLIEDYLLNPHYNQKYIVFVIDGNVGMTDKDIAMLEELEENKKNFIIALSKMDKLNQSDAHHRIIEIQGKVGKERVFPFSSMKGTGIDKIREEILS